MRKKTERNAVAGVGKREPQRSRIGTLKVRYFPWVLRNPLREVSYWPRNSIKRSNIEGPLRSFLVHRRPASPEIATFLAT